MALFSRSFDTAPPWPSALGTFGPLWDALAAATNRPAIVEVGCVATAAIGSQPTIGIGRSSSVSTQAGAVAPIPDDASDKPSVTSIATAWSVAPGVPTQYLRRAILSTAAGSGVIWTFPRGVVLGVSTSAGMFAAPAAAQNLPFSCHVVVNE